MTAKPQVVSVYGAVYFDWKLQNNRVKLGNEGILDNSMS